MRGLSTGPRRITNAAAFAAGAVLLAGAAGSAGAQPSTSSQDLAFVPPRLRLYEGAPRLPRPLSASDAERVRRIIAANAAADAATARALEADLSSPLLLGGLIADRYLRRPEQASLPELQEWFDRYAPLPEAPAIHALLVGRSPRGASLPPLPANDQADRLDPEESLPALGQNRNLALERSVRDAARRGRADIVLRLLRDTHLTAAYRAELAGEAAQEALIAGADEAVRAIADDAGARLPQAALTWFSAGLVDWRAGDAASASVRFEAAWHAAIASPAQRAAAAFWAARAHLRSGDPAGYAPWMRRAAAEPRSFYGMLGSRAMGVGIGFVADDATLAAADIEAVAALPAGLRAFAWLQVDEPARAEAELASMWPILRGNAALARAVLLIARGAGLDAISARLASLEQLRDGRLRDDARFPLPALALGGALRVDPTLVYAIARIESHFDPRAISPMGARGLMQLRPQTIAFINGSADTAALAQRLHEPGYNIEMGQRFLQYLARLDVVGQDLVRLIASYNAGPGNLQKWLDDGRDLRDPLLFIETIPLDETRHFVADVLRTSWMYAARMHRRPLGLDELSAGAWPKFESIDSGPVSARH
jgi:soluble lytic murein transglycosylase